MAGRDGSSVAPERLGHSKAIFFSKTQSWELLGITLLWKMAGRNGSSVAPDRLGHSKAFFFENLAFNYLVLPHQS